VVGGVFIQNKRNWKLLQPHFVNARIQKNQDLCKAEHFNSSVGGTISTPVHNPYRDFKDSFQANLELSLINRFNFKELVAFYSSEYTLYWFDHNIVKYIA
jgi:hypothetical protein